LSYSLPLVSSCVASIRHSLSLHRLPTAILCSLFKTRYKYSTLQKVARHGVPQRVVKHHSLCRRGPNRGFVPYARIGWYWLLCTNFSHVNHTQRSAPVATILFACCNRKPAIYSIPIARSIFGCLACPPGLYELIPGTGVWGQVTFYAKPIRRQTNPIPGGVRKIRGSPHRTAPDLAERNAWQHADLL